MAMITEYYRDIDKLGIILPENIIPQHSFFVYSNDIGQSYILRGGQYNDIFRSDGTSYQNNIEIKNLKGGDLAVVSSQFKEGSIDWFSDHSPTKPHIYYSGSDIVASRIWSSMVSGGQNINNNPTTYKLFIDNCNTALNTLGEIGRLEYNKILFEGLINGQSIPLGTFNGISIPLDKDGDEYFAPGIDRDLNKLNQDPSFLDFKPFKLEFKIKGEKFSILQGDKSIQLANSNLIASDAIYVDENNNPVSLYDSLFVGKDSQMKSFTIIKNNIYTTLQDNSKATLNSILNTLDSSIEITANFLTFQAQKTAEIILTKIKSDKYLDSLIGSVLADIILGENDAKQISKNLAKGQLNSLVTSLLDENIRKILIDSGMTTTQINNLVGPKAVNYAVTYDNSGNKIITAYDANGNLIGPTLNGTIYTAILNFAISAADSSGWSSEEYGTASANQNLNYHPKLNFNNNQKPNKKLVANDNYENIFILPLIKNA